MPASWRWHACPAGAPGCAASRLHEESDRLSMRCQVGSAGGRSQWSRLRLRASACSRRRRGRREAGVTFLVPTCPRGDARSWTLLHPLSFAALRPPQATPGRRTTLPATTYGCQAPALPPAMYGYGHRRGGIQRRGAAPGAAGEAPAARGRPADEFRGAGPNVAPRPLYGLHRANLNYRYPGSIRPWIVQQAASLCVGFIGLASCCNDRTYGSEFRPGQPSAA